MTVAELSLLIIQPFTIVYENNIEVGIFQSKNIQEVNSNIEIEHNHYGKIIAEVISNRIHLNVLVGIDIRPLLDNKINEILT
jgi:hypothetical protein